MRRRRTWVHTRHGTTNGRFTTVTQSPHDVALQRLPPPFAVALFDAGRYVGHFTNVHTAHDYAEGKAHEQTRRLGR